MSNLPAWVTIRRTDALPKWKVVDVQYISVESECNNGSTNVYVKALDEQGRYQAGIRIWQDWSEDRASDLTLPLAQANEYCGSKFGRTFFMSGDSSFDPAKGQTGPYAFYVDGMSDRVNGLGLPLRRHVQYLITFQRVTSEEPNPPSPPPPAGGAWRIVEQSATRLVLEWK